MSDKKVFNVMDLFCGIGGLSFGFAASDDFKIVYALDQDDDSCLTYSQNHDGVIIIHSDIAQVGFSELTTPLDVVVGGPPCQAFSTAGSRLLDDPRAFLFQEYYRALTETQPKVFVFENVPGILTSHDGELFATVLEIFKNAGYLVGYTVVDASHHLVPQKRKRVLVFGVREDVADSKHLEASIQSVFDAPSFSVITFRDATSDLPVISPGVPADEYDYISEPKNTDQKFMRSGLTPTQSLTHHSVRKYGQSTQQFLALIPKEGSHKDVDVSHWGGRKIQFPNSYKRLKWDQPGKTITRNFGVPSAANCIHPEQNRALSIREACRIQSIPDQFTFYGSPNSIATQIGNAVPPFLSFPIMSVVRRLLQWEN